MRNLEDIENDLAQAREALSKAEGTPAEVYSRIVGYYRSVRNWNLGKREEYGERRLYRINGENLIAAVPSPSSGISRPSAAKRTEAAEPAMEVRLLLFVRSSCPGCLPAKTAAGRLGIPVDLVNADTDDGMAEALRRNVMSTPTAILLSRGGEELRRAADAETIGGMLAGQRPMPVAV